MSIFILDGNAVDLDVATRGMVTPGHGATVRASAVGVERVAPTWAWSWRVPYLTRAEYEWFTQTVCGGELSIVATGETRLLTRDKEWLDFGECIVYAPRFDYFEANLFWGVTILVELTGIAQQPIVALGVVSDLAAVAFSDTQIDLSWTNVANDGYRIERSATGIGAWVEIDTVVADAVSYSDTGLTGGTVYYYRIRAYRDSENGLYSNIASAQTDPTVVNDWKTGGYTVLDSCGHSGSSVAEQAFDGNTSSAWIHNVADTPHFVNVDMGVAHAVSKVRRYKLSTGHYNWINARLYVSNDPDVWGSPVLTFTTGTTNNAWSEHDLSSPATGRYFRIECEDTGAFGDSLAAAEIEVYV